MSMGVPNVLTIHNFQLRTGNTGCMTINHDTGHVEIGVTTATERLHVNGNVLVSGTVTDSSDIRLKKNVKPLESALEKIMSLTGMNYDWITPEDHGGDRRQIGLIAQEVEVVFPEVVRSDSKGMLSVAYAKLIAPLIEAFKELVFRVDKNERSIASAQETLLDYKEKINRLESENQALKEAVCEINPSSQICVIQND